MDRSQLLSHVDHTLLRQDATWPEMQALCDEALHYHTASVCVPPSYVSQCAAYLAGRIPVCTVIGFPNGYATPATKAFEAADAVGTAPTRLTWSSIWAGSRTVAGPICWRKSVRSRPAVRERC